MSAAIGAAAETWRAVRSEVSARWGWFCLLTLLALVGYTIFILGMTALAAGRWPNYYRGFAVVEGVVDALTLPMPLLERYELLAEQPLFEFGYRHPMMESIEGAYTLTVHAGLNLGLMAVLIAVYGLLLARGLGTRGPGRRTVAGVGVGGGSSAVGLLTAGAASVACCGGTGASVMLSLLGAGTGIGVLVVEYDRAFGAMGLLLMLGNLWLAVRIFGPRESGGTLEGHAVAGRSRRAFAACDGKR